MRTLSMGDHFDISIERKLESSTDGAKRGVRRIDLITGDERRRCWYE